MLAVGAEPIDGDATVVQVGESVTGEQGNVILRGSIRSVIREMAVQNSV